MLGGATAGLPIIGVTWFNIQQVSKTWKGRPSLTELEGLSSIYTASAAIGIGNSTTTLSLGKTISSSNSIQAGLDASVDAFGGWAWFEKMKTEKCCKRASN